LEKPVELILRGNCRRDLAGTRLDFINPNPKAQSDIVEKIYTMQRGVVAGMTVSQRVKVPLISGEQFEEFLEQQKEIPFEWQNGLSLEWYTLTNDKVLIEATDYELKLTEHKWELDAKADRLQRLKSKIEVSHFLDIVEQAQDAEAHLQEDKVAEVDEFEWERRLKVEETIAEAEIFLNIEESDQSDVYDDSDFNDDEISCRPGIVRRAYRLRNETLEYLGPAQIDDGAHGQLAKAVKNIFSAINEAYPESEYSLQIGFKVAMLKRAIDASVKAIGSCNTIVMEDDLCAYLREDVFALRDEMVSLKHELSEVE